jgi:hypothetical protein
MARDAFPQLNRFTRMMMGMMMPMMMRIIGLGKHPGTHECRLFIPITL